jgi:hypothetical protein
MKTGSLKNSIHAVRALLAALAIGPFAASADVQTFTVGYDSLPVGLPNSSGPHNLVVPQFNPGLGTLESVDILLTMDSWLYHQYEFTGNGTSSTLTVTGHSQTVRLLDPFGGADLANQVHTVSDSHVLGARDGVTDYAGTGGVAGRRPPDCIRGAEFAG